MPNYPAEVEAWWLREAGRFCRTPDERAATLRLAKAAGELSDLFTTERAAHFGDYGRRPDLLRAYGLYAFPQTFARAQFVLRELAALGRLGAPARLLDLGCGTGAASAAVRHFFAEHPMSVHLVDQSAESLALASRLLGDLWPGTAISTQRANARGWSSPETFDLILCSFALGEMFFQQPMNDALGWLQSLGRSLAPGGWLLILEPALKETTERLVALRDELAAGGEWEIAAPCPHHLPCPLRREGRYWCHEVRSWNVPASLQRINNSLGRSVHELKFSFLVIRPGPPLQPTGPARLVAPMAKLKGRWATRLCAPDGELADIVIPKSATDEALRARLKSLERGDRVARQKDPNSALFDLQSIG